MPRCPRPLRRARATQVALALALVACQPSTSARRGLPPPTTVAALDLAAYMGTWHEIARFDERFQRGCAASQAIYSLRPDGTVAVRNRCRQGGPEASWREVHARARRPDPRAPGRLEVNFFGPFWADYWVLEVADDMHHAVVGHPSRDHLWILCRSPELADGAREAILSRLEAQGFDISRLLWTAGGAAP